MNTTNQLLKGKKGIIFGALNEKSIAWKVAERAFAEGAVFTLTNAPVALRFGEIQKLGEQCGAEVIPADASNVSELENLFAKSAEVLGGKIDFLLHSIAMSPNARKGIEYENLNYEYYMKTLDISAISFHKALHVAHKTDAFNEFASVVALTYIASQRTLFGYSDMTEAKAVLESITRNFGYILGRQKKVRINTVSQSPTPTTAVTAIKDFDRLLAYAEKNSPLGNADALDCANFCVMLFSDYTRKVTMQNLFHDGGFSAMTLSREVMDVFNKGME